MTQDTDAREVNWTKWLTEATILAKNSWTRDRSVSITCTPGGFWVEGRQLVRSHRAEVRAQQLRPYSQVDRAQCNVLTDAVERVLHMLECAAERKAASPPPSEEQ